MSGVSSVTIVGGGPRLVLVGPASGGDSLPSQSGNSGKYLTTNGTSTAWDSPAGAGTVTTFSVVTANGVSASVANATSTPAATFTLGAITPTSVNGLTITTTTGTITITNAKTLAVTNTLTLSGTDGSTLNVGTGGTLGTAAYTASGDYQPIDADLTAIAALTTNSVGRDLLTVTAINSVASAAGFDLSFLGGSFPELQFAISNKTTARSSLGLVIGTDVPALTGSSSMTTLGTITTGTWNGSIIESTYGGTGNGFTKFTGPTTAERTFTLPNASATILTSNAAVTVAQGGTGLTALGSALQVLRTNAGATGLEYATLSGGGNAQTADPLSQFAATTSAQLAGVISDETGSGSLVFATSPTFVTPSLGAATAASLAVNGALTQGSGSSYTFTGTDYNFQIASTGAISVLGGTINGTTIGGTTPAAGTFTTLVAGSTTSLLLGTAGAAVGNIGFRNATSGTLTLAPPTGALGTIAVTLPNAASTLPIYPQQITYTGPSTARTITLPDANFTVARTDAANTFTGVQTMTSPAFTTSITTASTSFTALAGATTLLTLGGTGASASTNFPSTLDATSTTTGAIRTAGGISCVKALVVGATGTFGATTSLLLGTAGTAVGNIGFRNATSGTITLAPTTGALGTVTQTMQAVTGTIYCSGGTDVAVADGGTGLSSGTSGGVLAFTASGTIASSGALAANAIVIGGGAGVAPSTTTTGTGVLTQLGLAADGTDVDAIGYRGLPQVSFSAATNIIATHNGCTLLHPSSDANARTLTIQANGTLALEVGFAFEVINDSASAVTLAITTDTLVQAGTGTTGSITIPQYGCCFVRKIASTRWYATPVVS
jgi:hypothetical protein